MIVLAKDFLAISWNMGEQKNEFIWISVYAMVSKNLWILKKIYELKSRMKLRFVLYILNAYIHYSIYVIIIFCKTYIFTHA